MSVELVALGTLEGVEVHRPPVGGVVWDRGALLRLDGAEVAWRLSADEAPPLALAGRRLYAGYGEWLVCLDVRTGAEVWAADCGARIVAIDAHPDGVDVLADARVLTFDPRGEPGSVAAIEPGGTLLRRVRDTRYVATAAGIFRLAPGQKPALLYACACHGLYDRAGALQALAEGPPGTVLVEDDGLAMVWPFADAASHLVAPWGRADWAVVPRQGRGGLWVVDRRVQTRWQVPLPGRALALGITDRALAVALDDEGPVLALIHPDVSTPLLLAVEGVDALSGDGPHLYLTHAGDTDVLLVRESH